MNLIEIKENLQSEYNKLISELEELRKLYTEKRKLYDEMELKDLELYYELEDLSDKLKADTKIDEENEKQYIENNCNKLAIKIPFTCGLLLSVFIFLYEILTGNLITNIIFATGLITGHLSTGIIIGIIIYTLYKKKYITILKDRYKHSDTHLKFSTDHYDKMIKLIGKKENYNRYNQEYLKVITEYNDLGYKLLNKEEELKLFKEKVFEILFQNEKELTISEENIEKEDICYNEESKIKKRVLKNN